MNPNCISRCPPRTIIIFNLYAVYGCFIDLWFIFFLSITRRLLLVSGFCKRWWQEGYFVELWDGVNVYFMFEYHIPFFTVDVNVSQLWLQDSKNTVCRDQCVYAPRQWEMALHCNAAYHWVGAYTEWSEHVLQTAITVIYTSVTLHPV